MFDLQVTEAHGPIQDQLQMEIVERKGKGHPDTICDRAAEELSISLSKYYREESAFGRVMHHNVDKCVLAGGQSTARLGGGEVIEPIYLLMVGRAVLEDSCRSVRVPIGKFAVKDTKEWLQKSLPNLQVGSDIIIDYKIRSGSTDLLGNFERGTDAVPLANDTSFAVGYAPLSDVERVTLETELLLNSPETKKKYPHIGEDIKVMGVREGDVIDLTIAAAVVSRYTPDKDSYSGIKEQVALMARELGEKITGGRRKIQVEVNTADGNTDDSLYLTVTGTSAEHGDDGQVGRGNRPNGLLTPYRPMTLEAAAGKNPVSHVGKIYSVMSQIISERMVKEAAGVDQCLCYMVSQIGRPITEPRGVNVEIHSTNGIKGVRDAAQKIVTEVLGNWKEIQNGFLERRWGIY